MIGFQNAGQNQSELFRWLSEEWLELGPPVCFVEGFPGVGKSFVANELIRVTKLTSALVIMPKSVSTVTDDLLMDIATRLSEEGHDDMADAITSGTSLASAFARLLTKPVLIIIDEFENTFINDSDTILKSVKDLLDRLSKSPGLPGRILLLSNRLIPKERWSEHHEIKALSGLTSTEAKCLLVSLLQERNRTHEIPSERHDDVVSWLGLNPRAIGSLSHSEEKN